MSRVPRNEVGLDVVCHRHPTNVLFWPRMALDSSRRLREAGPRHIARVYIVDQTAEGYQPGGADRYKYTRRCESLMDPQRPDGPRCGLNVQLRLSHVRLVLLSLAQFRRRKVWVVTSDEIEEIIRRGPRAYQYLARLEEDGSSRAR